MPYAECRTCHRLLTRSGGRGFNLHTFCCPACGGDLRNAPRPPATQGRAVLKWVYQERKHDPVWVRAMCQQEDIHESH